MLGNQAAKRQISCNCISVEWPTVVPLWQERFSSSDLFNSSFNFPCLSFCSFCLLIMRF
ncbi:hypothetical protein SynRS9915_00430 [Synechococcus sp. RS9915]|nr:hypothetical protein SynRS9915_00430 [Synechococcus sp. RS9915]